MDQLRTPLYDVLKQHRDMKTISLHVPGHKNGMNFPSEYKELFGDILQTDVTELTLLDDLHSPESVILEAEELLANLYGVENSFFLINGSTVGNLAMIMATLEEGDEVIVQRNCHKSILNGIQLAKADPLFVEPVYDPDWKVAGGVTLETVKEAIESFPKAKAIILTYPNYYGMVFDLRGIIELAHRFGIPVLVDEAHGAHFISGGIFPESATELGADVIVQSAHKTLPAMTMGSFLHFNSQFVSLEKLTRYLRILQSSSPSYPIMASLDVARRYLSQITDRDLDDLNQRFLQLKSKLNRIMGIRVLEGPIQRVDPLKLTIQSTTSVSGFELQQLFEKEGVFTELADPNNVLLVLPFLKANVDFPFNEIVSSISRACCKLPEGQADKRLEIRKLQPAVSQLAVGFEEQKSREKRSVPISEAVGLISGELITPYPPGIPLLFPGEEITEAAVVHLVYLLEKGARFQGGAGLKQGNITVYI
jgi:arginine/lysine/ornithine decarboxylase